MKRRQFITLLGGGAAWPLAARAQQGGAGPAVGFLAGATRDEYSALIAAALQGLQESRHVEG